MKRLFHECLFTCDLSLRYFAQTMKVKMAYRWDFFIQTAGTILFSIVNIAVIAALLTRVPAIQGWSLWEVLLIYGFGELCFGLFAILCFNAINLFPGHYLVEGNLDRVLLRPMNSYLQVVLENLSTNDFVIVLKGLAIIVLAGANIEGFRWTLPKLLGGGALALAGAAIYCACFTAAAALSFWFTDRTGLFNPLFPMSDYSRYPITMYPTGIRIFFSWIVPFAFVACYPASFVLQKEGLWDVAPAGIGVAIAFSVLAAGLWKAGLRRYESTGT